MKRLENHQLYGGLTEIFGFRPAQSQIAARILYFGMPIAVFNKDTDKIA